jgi:MFS family permease
MVFFIAVGIFQGAYFSYIVGSASTLEKRFSYSSKYTGYIMIADTFSSTITSSVAGFIGKRYNKSLLIACGMTFVGLSCLINSFPFFYYGPNSYAQNMHQSSVLSTSDKSQHDLCGSSVGSIIEKCDIDNDIDGMVWPAFLCVWMASFVNGIGYSSFFTLGYPFVDDNVNKANAPLFLAIVSAFRNFGPTIGYMTTTLCLSLREDFLYTSVDVVRLDRTDPRYIGAWWLGFIILAVIIMLLSFPLYLFPKEIKGHKVNREEEEELHMSFFADAKKTTIRVVTNPVIISDSLAGLFHWIGIGGFYLTKPKYIESQYQKSAAEASLTTGLYGTLAMSIGVIMGGAFLKYVRPSPRMLCALILTVEFSMSVAFFISLFLGCPKIHFVGFDEEPPLFGCNDKCDCAGKAFQPVCGSDGVTTYFSPCYAGCKTPFKDINGTLFFRWVCLNSFIIDL